MIGSLRLRGPGVRALIILSLTIVLVHPIAAQSARGSAETFALGASFFDVSGKLGQGIAIEVGYTPTWNLTTRIRPRLGSLISSDGAAYGYFGLEVPLHLHPNLVLAPSFAAGAFSAGRDSDLGSALEFRSALELSFRLAGDDSINLAFYHLSNAGFGEENPGLELVGLTYSFAQ